MSFERALAAALSVPESKGVVLGWGTLSDTMHWAAGTVDEIEILISPLSAEARRTILKSCREFSSTGRRPTISVSSYSNDNVTMLILAPESEQSVAELLRGSAEQMAARYVTRYLAEKQVEWRGPTAKVMPFRRKQR